MAITVTLNERTIDAALACLAAVAADEREPQRYRDWYSSAYEELAAAYKNGSDLSGSAGGCNPTDPEQNDSDEVEQSGK